MQSSAQLTPTTVKAESYQLRAYSSAEKVSLKQCQSRLPPEFTERYSQDCLVFHKEYQEKIFIFKFGTVVFLNVPDDQHAAFLSQLGFVPKDRETNPEEDAFVEEVFNLRVQPEVNEVSFNEVVISKYDPTKVQIVAQVVAQSSALELLEWEVEDFMQESERMTVLLKKSTWAKGTRQSLIQFLGGALSARHRMLNQLALLDDPEKTWEKEDLYKMYIKLFDNFDIKERIEKIEKMLELSADVSALLLEIQNTRRQEFFEIVIIGLIAFEIFQSFFK